MAGTDGEKHVMTLAKEQQVMFQFRPPWHKQGSSQWDFTEREGQERRQRRERGSGRGRGERTEEEIRGGEENIALVSETL